MRATKMAFVLTAMLATVGCIRLEGILGTGERKPSPGKGELVLKITDKPIAGIDVKKIRIRVTDIKVCKASTSISLPQTLSEGTEAQEITDLERDEEEKSGWIDIPLKDEEGNEVESKEFDLLELTGIEALLGSAELDPGLYTQIRLTISEARITINKEGTETEYPMKLTGNERLKIVGVFEVKEGEHTTITLDFEAERSVVITGKENYILKPVIKIKKIEQKLRSSS